MLRTAPALRDAHGWGKEARLPIGAVLASACLGLVMTAVAVRAGDAAPLVLLLVGLVPLVALLAYLYPVAAVICVFASFPIGSLSLPGGLLKIVQAVVLGAATIVLLRRAADGRTPLRWAQPLVWAVALIGWTLVSLGSAADVALALKQIAALTGGVVFALVVVTVCDTIDRLRLALVSFVLVSTGTAMYAVSTAGSLSASFGGSIIEGRLTGTFSHPNELGSFCAMAALVAAGTAIGAPSRVMRYSLALCIPVLLLGLTLSFARGAWIGLVGGTLFLLVTLPEARRATLLFALPLIVVALSVGSLTTTGKTQIQTVSTRLGALSETSPYDDRHQIWSEALREIRERPIVGGGPGSFPVTSTRSTSVVATVSAEHAHNLPLTWAAEVGIPAVLLILGLVVSLAVDSRRAARIVRRRGDTQGRALLAGLQAALVAMVCQGAVDYTFRNAVVFLALWSVIGSLLACVRIIETNEAREPPAASRRLRADSS